MTKLKKLPFTLDRADEKSLTMQISAGFLNAIRSGYYKSGDRLPPLLAIAEELQVCAGVVCNAMRKLTRDGVVVARRRHGMVVASGGGHKWDGHVLYISWQSDKTFCEIQLQDACRKILAERNFHMSRCSVNMHEQELGYPTLKTMLDSQVFSLAIINGGSHGIDGLLVEHDLAFIQYAADHHSKLARSLITADDQRAHRDMMAYAGRNGMRSVLVVSRYKPDSAEYRKHGLMPEWLEVMQFAGELTESHERAGLAAMQAYLAKGKPRHELIFFADDYEARGGLTALLAAHINIPEDVKVITIANQGNMPVYIKPLTRIEYSPIRLGQTLAEKALSLCRRMRKCSATEIVNAEFVAGETA